MTKGKNPLYVVKNNSNVVEEATGWFDALLKKYDLEKVWQFVTSMLQMALDQVKTLQQFDVVKSWYDQILAQVEVLMEMIQSLLPSKA